jgi:iron complex transport system permease protein
MVMLPILLLLLSLMLGRYLLSPGHILACLGNCIGFSNNEISDIANTVLFNIRLPRVLGAMAIGAGLAASGAAYQGLFRNPMVSPDLLGASAGAGFGAAIGIILSLGMVGIQTLSFLGGLIAVLITWTLGRNFGHGSAPTLVLVLAGMLVSTVFSSLLSFLKYVADPYSKLPAITFWLMGSLASVDSRDVYLILFPAISLGLIGLYLIRWQLNVMSFGEDEALALGVNTRKIRAIVIIAATLMTAVSVSIAGLIGWVGLLIPHLARMLVGPDYRVLLPASALMGATYLLLVDDLARCMTDAEIPLGILTSLIGAPFFLLLMLRLKRGWL